MTGQACGSVWTTKTRAKLPDGTAVTGWYCNKHRGLLILNGARLEDLEPDSELEGLDCEYIPEVTT